MHPDGKKVFQPILRRPTSLKRPEALCGIPDSGGFATIFAGLEPAKLPYLACFSGKSPNLDVLHPSIAAEWDRLAAE
jgi:hypothetical protein